jgi:hypothetical protein
MEKIIVLILIALLSPVTFSQNPNGWIEEGAEWHHRYWAMQTGYVRHYLDGTETINDTVYQVVRSQFQLAYNQPDGSVSVGSLTNGGTYHFFTSGDSVFMRRNNALQFVWHRNPQIGDIWDFGVQGTDEDGNPIHAYAIVQGFEPIEIDGIPTTDIIVAPCKDDQGTLFSQGEQGEGFDNIHPYAMFVSRINTLVGPRHDFSYIGQFYTLQVIAITSFYYDRILCYSSDNTNLFVFPNEIDCNNGILSSSEFNVMKNVIFPNPASTSFTLTHPEQIKSIQIFDVQGRLQSSHTSVPIHIENLNAGVYWVHVESLDGTVRVEKLVTE